MSRVRENRTHGSRWRREETGTSRQCRAELCASRRPYSDLDPARASGERLRRCAASRIVAEWQLSQAAVARLASVAISSLGVLTSSRSTGTPYSVRSSAN